MPNQQSTSRLCPLLSTYGFPSPAVLRLAVDPHQGSIYFCLQSLGIEGVHEPAGLVWFISHKGIKYPLPNSVSKLQGGQGHLGKPG